MKRVRSILLVCGAVFATIALANAAQVDIAKLDTGLIPSPRIQLPDGKMSAAVVLISDAAGWGAEEENETKALLSQGAAIIGIDFPSYLASLAKADDDCLYLVSDIESLSQQVQRTAGNSAYRLPIVAGRGEGGALALAIASQTPAATIGETVAVDPLPGIPLGKELCTTASKQKAGSRMLYGLQDEALPDAVTIVFTSSGVQASRDHAQSLKKAHDGIDIRSSGDDAAAALSETLAERVEAVSGMEDPLGLPIDVLEAKPALDTMAVIYSGDGGWRDLDKEIGSYLQSQGIPVIGVDSLRYFWSERKPQETADDLARIIAYYRKAWNVRRVLLVGYSFGADILPATFNRLQAAEKASVAQISLLALSRQVDYVISVTGWLGVAGAGKGGDTVEDLKKVDPKLVQCAYGKDEDEDPCPTLKASGVEVLPVDGGHHFDGDYEALAKKIIAGLKMRLAR
ncbi:MAG: virulence factor family protein [Parvibaculaceae bacterium]